MMRSNAVDGPHPHVCLLYAAFSMSHISSCVHSTGSLTSCLMSCILHCHEHPALRLHRHEHPTREPRSLHKSSTRAVCALGTRGNLEECHAVLHALDEKADEKDQKANEQGQKANEKDQKADAALLSSARVMQWNGRCWSYKASCSSVTMRHTRTLGQGRCLGNVCTDDTCESDLGFSQGSNSCVSVPIGQ